MSTLNSAIQHCTGGSSQGNQAKKEVGIIQIEKKISKIISICTGYITLYKDNPKESIKNYYTLIVEFRTFSECKINILKNQLYFYTLHINYLKTKLRKSFHLL